MVAVRALLTQVIHQLLLLVFLPAALQLQIEVLVALVAAGQAERAVFIPRLVATLLAMGALASPKMVMRGVHEPGAVGVEEV